MLTKHHRHVAAFRVNFVFRRHPRSAPTPLTPMTSPTLLMLFLLLLRVAKYIRNPQSWHFNGHGGGSLGLGFSFYCTLSV